jgi:ABC-type lipoprotein export system ATPase subunit
MLEANEITMDFSDGKNISHVLSHLTITIDDGDYITIMGESGCGKSTLLNILSLLLKPTSGQIKVDKEIVNFSKEKNLVNLRGKQMGLVFQNPNLISCMNPIENLQLAMLYNKRKDKTKIAKELLDKVGLSDKYYAKIKSLSGGEAQRVSLVRALVNDPKILLCDEPTGALDHANSQNVIDILENICKERKCSLVIVTHNANIWNRGTRKIKLEGGQIYEVV